MEAYSKKKTAKSTVTKQWIKNTVTKQSGKNTIKKWWKDAIAKKKQEPWLLQQELYHNKTVMKEYSKEMNNTITKQWIKDTVTN